MYKSCGHWYDENQSKLVLFGKRADNKSKIAASAVIFVGRKNMIKVKPQVQRANAVWEWSSSSVLNNRRVHQRTSLNERIFPSLSSLSSDSSNPAFSSLEQV